MIDQMLESYAAMEPAMKIFVTLGSVSSCVLFTKPHFPIQEKMTSYIQHIYVNKHLSFVTRRVELSISLKIVIYI